MSVPAAPPRTTSAYRVRGLDCAEEVALLRAELLPLAGIHDLEFDLLRGRMAVHHDSAVIEAPGIVAAVSRTGLRAEVWSDAKPAPPPPWHRDTKLVSTIASGFFLACAFFADGMTRGWWEALSCQSEGLGTLPRVFNLLAVGSGVWFVLPKAWGALRRLRPDMNSLMVLAVAGALLLGEWLEGAVVAFLFALSLVLESWSVSRARKAIEKLMDLSPARARVLSLASACNTGCCSAHTDDENLLGVADVPVGSRILVKPGEKFPLDGRIAKGAGEVNQAPITGESMSIARGEGDGVFAGTINGASALEVETTREAGDTTLARMVRLVSEAQSRRAGSERWVEKFARIYTPVVMMLAALLAVVPPLLMGGAWSAWTYQALVLLVIACPCALVISTPVSIVAALASAARQGVLVKGGLFMELPAKVRAIAFDKTGTITTGLPSVGQVVPLNGASEEELLALAAALEAHSEHPLGAAVVAAAKSRSLPVPGVSDFKAVTGMGAAGVVAGRALWIGSHRFARERGAESAEVTDAMARLTAGGGTVVALGEAGRVLGLIALTDTVRPGAAAALAELHAAGIATTVLTGDNRAAGEAAGRAVGACTVEAELLPEDKIAAIEHLVERHGTVAMVGDGVNDAPAMARASLGIAMGAGTDAAMETADITLLRNDLSRIPWLVRHSRRTLAIIRQNVALALGIKAVFFVLAWTGLATLWGAIAADMGVSLLVVFNALRLLEAKT